MSEFKREHRYFVFKVKDLEAYCNRKDIDDLAALASDVDSLREEDGKPPLVCVVVEQDWPEYEPTWAAIEARMSDQLGNGQEGGA